MSSDSDGVHAAASVQQIPATPTCATELANCVQKTLGLGDGVPFGTLTVADAVADEHGEEQPAGPSPRMQALAQSKTEFDPLDSARGCWCDVPEPTISTNAPAAYDAQSGSWSDLPPGALAESPAARPARLHSTRAALDLMIRQALACKRHRRASRLDLTPPSSTLPYTRTDHTHPMPQGTT